MRNFSRYKDIPEHVKLLGRKKRVNQTHQENLLWEKLSGKKINGLKFRRQFPIERYIADFYNHSNKLIIEVDGEIHNHRKEYDKNRENYLKACGYVVLRFTNNQIENDIEKVIETIISMTS